MKRPASKSGALQPLAPIVEHVMHQAGLGRITLLGRLQQQWQTIAGPQVAAVTSPEGLRGRVLFVTVSDAIWLQQLTFYHAQLLHNIRQALGDVPIARLHFTLASSVSRSAPEAEEAPKLSHQPLAGEEERQVLERTAAITDPELREAVRRAWRRGWETKR
jgi:predicted nucleic acid-binding Zn ribbon protein